MEGKVPGDVCRWGILSTSKIAHKTWQAIWFADNASLSAVASRDKNKSKDFVARCQAQVPFPQQPEATGSYQELLDRDDVDAVYIPLPTGLRKEWIIKAADAGKHVICEKPCAINSIELGEMLSACERNNVQFMDGVMFMHSKRLDSMRNVIDDPQTIGKIRRIYSQFSFLADDEFRKTNIRIDSQLEPLGCLGDLGWYNIRFTLWVLNWKLPYKVRARTIGQSNGKSGKESVPTEFAAELFFEDDVSAGFYCSFETGNQQCATVSGTRGYIELDDFVLPFNGDQISFESNQSEFIVECCRFEMRQNQHHHATRESSNNAADAQEANMFRNFSRIVLSGTIDKSWPTIAFQTQLVADACFESAKAGSKLIEIPKP